MIGISLCALFVMYFVVFSAIPFSWYVDIQKVHYNDVCVGDDAQLVEAWRVPRWDIPGQADARVIDLANHYRIETTIVRQDVNFVYEKGDHAKYLIRWSEPFEKPGMYTVEEDLTIKPLPLIESHLFYKNINSFNATICE
jgi:hypothetical protein